MATFTNVDVRMILHEWCTVENDFYKTAKKPTS